MSAHSHRALPARRVRVLDDGPVAAVVVDVDATEDPQALAVLQASLHDLPDDAQLGYGYDLSVAGLGAWVGDRRIRVEIWPAIRYADGTIDVDDPADPTADVLVIDIGADRHGDALDALARLGRLVVAGPEGGPLPLVLDVDPEVVAAALAALRSA